jgi:DNA polymerase-3 subunit delta
VPPRGPRTSAVVAILGADSYRAEAALQTVLKDGGFPHPSDAVQMFRGDETSWVRLLDITRTGSLFAERRAVVVRGAELLKGEGEEMASYLASPSEDVALVLMAAKVDKRKKLWKGIVDAATVVDAEPLKGRALRAHVEGDIRKRGLKLSEDAIVELLDRVGQDLRRLMGELDKLEAYTAKTPGARLSADDVAGVLGRGLARPLYRLGDAMMARRTDEVLSLLAERLDDGEPALLLLATLHRSVRQARGARALIAARASRDELVSRLGILPFKAGDVMDAARRWTDGELQEAVAALSRADRRLKLGGDPKVVMTVAVAEACRRREAPRRSGAR